MKYLLTILICFKTAFAFSQISESHYRIYFFLHPECPISQQYVPYINQVVDSFSNQIPVFSVFGGKKSKKLKPEIESFTKKYQLRSRILLDPNNIKAKQWGATITPEVFVISKEKEIVYYGAIDNRYFQLGRLRPEITEKYLEEVISDILKGTVKKYPHQKALGCFLEY